MLAAAFGCVFKVADASGPVFDLVDADGQCRIGQFFESRRPETVPDRDTAEIDRQDDVLLSLRCGFGAPVRASGCGQQAGHQWEKDWFHGKINLG